MNVSAAFIKRPVMTTLVSLAVIFFGILSYNQLPVASMPDVEYPVIQVNVNNPGSSADTMASTVAIPLEQQFMQISGLQLIQSTSYTGYTQFALTFDLNRNLDGASTDVLAAIQRASANLPPLPEPPSYKTYNPAASPIVYVALTSETMTVGDLYDYGNTVVGQRLAMLPGVSNVAIYGSKYAIHVKVNPDSIASKGLGMNEVALSAINATQNLPGGNVYDTKRNFAIMPDGQLLESVDYGEMIVAYRNGAAVRVNDIGFAVKSQEQETLYVDYWREGVGSRPACVLAITKQSSANALAVCQDVIDMLPVLRSSVPEAIDMEIIYTQKEEIEASVHDVEFTLLLAFALVVFVIFLFLGKMSATIIPSIALPMSIIGTFLIMLPLGFSIDILSLLGFTLVVGFLVDDAIVVLENIIRHMEMGKSPMQAAFEGAKQIAPTVVSMTLSLVAVFIPLLFMPGLIGKMFHEFAVVTVLAVLFSGLVSLTLTPMLCSRFIRTGKVSNLEKAAHRIFEVAIGWYSPMLSWVLRHRWVPIAATLISLGIAGHLFLSLPQDFLPPGDTGVIRGVTMAPQGTAPQGMADYHTALDAILVKNPALESLISVTNLGSYTANNQGLLVCFLKDSKQRPPIDQVALQLMQEARDGLIGMLTFLKLVPQINMEVGTGQTKATYSYIVSGVAPREDIYEQTRLLAKKMYQRSDLFKDVNTDIEDINPQVSLTILRDQAAALGIDVKQIEETFAIGYTGGKVTTFTTELDQYDVIVDVQDEYKRTPAALDRLWMRGNSAQGLVPLGSVVSLSESTGPLLVDHTNQFVSATISFNTPANVALGEATSTVEGFAKEILKDPISGQFIGQAQEFQTTMGAISVLLILGIIVIYIVLGILYESFIHPVTILTALPGACFGALLSLVAMQATLSLYAYIGIIVLIGIAMKNGIMLVEFANEEIEHGKSPKEAIISACQLRFRPIMMTTVAAIVGALPIAIGYGADGASRQPLGVAVVGGLIFTQLVTFFLTPVIYLSFEELQQKFRSPATSAK